MVGEKTIVCGKSARWWDNEIEDKRLYRRHEVYHKGAIAPLYIGIVVVGQHRSHTFGKSAFPWQ